MAPVRTLTLQSLFCLYFVLYNTTKSYVFRASFDQGVFFFAYLLIGAGYILKYDYRVTARKHGITINVQGVDDINMFPIEEARLRSVGLTISTAGSSTIGYGWALRYRTVSSPDR